MNGMAGFYVDENNKDSKVFIGHFKNPIAIIKRGEIKTYLTAEFWDYFECWRIANAGYGLPLGPGWAQYPNLFMEILTGFSEEYRSKYSGHSN